LARHTGGWIKLHRRLLTNEDFKDPLTLAIFVRLLLMATHDKGVATFRGKARPLKPGETVCSTIELAETLGAHRSAIRRRLKRLTERNVIDQQSDQHGTIVTIQNWAKYQHTDDERDQRVVTKTTNKPTNETPPKRPPMENEFGQEEKNNTTPLYPPAKAKGRKISKRARAEQLATSVLGAYQLGLSGPELDRALAPEAKSVLAKRFGSWGGFCGAYERARMEGDGVPFEYKLVKTIIAHLPTGSAPQPEAAAH
jgi:hypothetical protein